MRNNKKGINMQVIEQDLGKSYYQKLLDIRELPIGQSVFFLIIEAKKEIKNEMGQIFFINNGLEAPLDKASDFADLKQLSKKAFFFNNTLFNNAFANNVIKEGDLIKITKKANVGDVVQQKHGKKKINYFDYRITICNKEYFCVTNLLSLSFYLNIKRQSSCSAC